LGNQYPDKNLGSKSGIRFNFAFVLYLGLLILKGSFLMLVSIPKVIQPRRDSMGLMSRPFVTSSTFLGDDHRKLIVGTGHHQVFCQYLSEKIFRKRAIYEDLCEWLVDALVT
jgi:hypothetical protein